MLTSISTTLHEAAESSAESASSQGELRNDQQKSTTTVMPVFDRTQVNAYLHGQIIACFLI